MKTLVFLIAAALALSGCKSGLSFGDDVELSGAAFDHTKLAEITKLTGIHFPTGSKGLEYYYQGSGIDDALAAKVQIPADRVSELILNPVFSTGSNSKPSIQIGKSKTWWKIDGLTDRVDRTLNLPKARFLEVTLGKEGSDTVLYLSWITT